MSDLYEVRLAIQAEVALLPRIEEEAARRFTESGWPEIAATPGVPLDELQEAQIESRLWVALGPSGAPVGFALADMLGEHAHLREVDVLPEHGRLGLGRRLIEAVGDWARRQRFAALTLTTFRDIPWNAPYYARLGFEALPPERQSATLRLLVAEEALAGLDPARRVVMILRFKPGKRR